jgi:hypothetical protein
MKEADFSQCDGENMGPVKKDAVETYRQVYTQQ